MVNASRFARAPSRRLAGLFCALLAATAPAVAAQTLLLEWLYADDLAASARH